MLQTKEVDPFLSVEGKGARGSHQAMLHLHQAILNLHEEYNSTSLATRGVEIPMYKTG